MIARERHAQRDAALLHLAKMDRSIWPETVRTIAETAAEALDVSRASVWLFSDDGSEAVCEDLFVASDHRHEQGVVLRSADYPSYVRALREQRTIAAVDARTHPDTREFKDGYLDPLGICSMLDVPVWHRGRLAGVVCHEQAGSPREWTPHDEDFAASIAEMVALALEARERVRAEELFKSAFERSSIGMALIDLEDRYVRVNAAFCDLFGYSADEMVGMTTLSVSHPEDMVRLGRTKTATNSVLAGQSDRLEVEKRYRRKDGSFFWALVGVSLVRDAAGRPLHWISQVQDITERKRAEEELRRTHDELEARVAQRTAELARANAALEAEIVERKRSDEELRQTASELQAIFRALPDLYFRMDTDGRILEYRACDACPRYAPSPDVLGRRIDETLPPHVAAQLLQAVRQVAADGTAACIEYSLQPDEHEVHFEARLVRLNGDCGDEVIAVVRDITDRVEAERALQRSEEHFRMLTENASDVVAILEREGIIRYQSPAAERLFGYPNTEMVNRWAFEFFHPDDIAPTAAALARVIENPGSTQYAQFRFHRKDGEYIYCEAVGRTLLPDTPEAGVVVNTRDITARKEAEEALRESEERLRYALDEAEAANRAKSEFLSRMSHELRTPMNSILGFAQILARRPLPPDQMRSVDYILKAGRHLLELINEVLDIARIEANRLQLSLEPVGVTGALNEALSLIGPLAAQRGCRIEACTTMECERYVLADRQRLTQVLLNLLSNSVKYNRPEGTVQLSCEAGADETGARLWIRVRDTGPGIPPDKMPRLFVPFERLGADQAGIEGTGLGLALSKRLVEAMGGILTAESALGEGSTFSVGLALAESPLERLSRAQAAGAGETQRPVPEKSATLLYVEDNLANLNLIETILAERAEIRLLSALQGRLGLDLAWEHHPDLILLDLHLPDISGEEVLRRLQEDGRTRDIPVVIISADATPGTIERLLRSGARGYLPKPLDVDQFLKTVDEILEEK